MTRRFLKRLTKDERGATIVEFTLIFPMLLILTFGIIEMGLLFFQWNSAERATQIGVRTAVTNNSVFNAWTSDCGQVSVPSTVLAGSFCTNVPGSDTWTVTCDGAGLATGCDSAAMTLLVTRMQAIFPRVTQANVVVEFSGAGLGFVGRGSPVPVVSVSLQNMQYDLLFLDALLGWGDTFAMPPFTATMTGEDLNTAGAG